MANMKKKYLKLTDVKTYVISRKISKLVWEIVSKWDYIEKRTVGGQFIRSADSIGANIAEGFGRYHKKDKIKFYYNARGSVYEVFHWIELSLERNLLDELSHKKLMENLRILPREINHLIKMTFDKLTI